jgi:aconitate hydratase
LQDALDELGYAIVGFGCATCVGNSGPLDAALERDIVANGVVACAVLSGNRNFEARIHPAVRAAYLASPPLVVAYALAGTIAIDFEAEPLGTCARGGPVHLRDIWPDAEEIERLLEQVDDPSLYRDVYAKVSSLASPSWSGLRAKHGSVFEWDDSSTYILEPPFVRDAALAASPVQRLEGARALAILGDSVTTDHISPIGTILPDSVAGLYLRGRGVPPEQLGTYGARRMNHEVMARGTFANPRLRNTMVDREGPFTIHHPSGAAMTIFDAARRYADEATPLVVVAGMEYGTGSSRDWAAKGPRLLGVRAVIAGSFERIHRSNLVGMGILPCELPAGVSARSLNLGGSEQFAIDGLDRDLQPRQPLPLSIEREDGRRTTVPVTLRVDTAAELRYVRNGGLLLSMLSSIREAA